MSRTYGDRCGIARALDVVGERWALLVVRELLLGPKRFTDLRAGLPNAGPDMLAQRLRELEQAGVVRGQELESVVLELGFWGSVAPFPSADARIGADATVIALKTLFDPVAADGVSASYELRFGDQRFRLLVADGRLDVARGEAEHPDAAIETQPGTLATVLWHGHRLDDALQSGDIKLEGSRKAVTRFMRLFPLPA
jgi:hypothetical protein